jgi:hypothetical protein
LGKQERLASAGKSCLCHTPVGALSLPALWRRDACGSLWDGANLYFIDRSPVGNGLHGIQPDVPIHFYIFVQRFDGDSYLLCDTMASGLGNRETSQALAGHYLWHLDRIGSSDKAERVHAGCVRAVGHPSGPIRLASAELSHFRTTFWANFGYGNIPLPAWIYTALDIFVVGGAIGFLVALVRRLRHGAVGAARRDQLAILSVWALLTMVGLYWYWQRTIAVTGRQLYSILPLIALGLVVGWAAFVPHRRRIWIAGAICVLMFILAAGSWLGALVPAYRQSPRLPADEVVQTVQHRLDWQFGDVATLVGYDLSPAVISAGQKATITFYWQPLRTLSHNLTTFVHLLGEGNQAVGARDTYPGLGNDPTIYWTPGDVLVDAIPIRIVPDANGPVLLDVEAGLYDLATGDRLEIRDTTGNIVGHPVIGTVKLLGDPQALKAPAHSLDARFQGDLLLEGYDLSATTLEPGSELSLTLYWVPAGPLAADYTTFVHLVNEEGQILAQGDAPPRDGRYPTTAWAAGERFQDTYELVIPTGVQPGSYYLLAGLYNPHNSTRLPLADGSDHVRLGSAIVVER